MDSVFKEFIFGEHVCSFQIIAPGGCGKVKRFGE